MPNNTLCLIYVFVLIYFLDAASQTCDSSSVEIQIQTTDEQLWNKKSITVQIDGRNKLANCIDSGLWKVAANKIPLKVSIISKYKNVLIDTLPPSPICEHGKLLVKFDFERAAYTSVCQSSIISSPDNLEVYSADIGLNKIKTNVENYPLNISGPCVINVSIYTLDSKYYYPIKITDEMLNQINDSIIIDSAKITTYLKNQISVNENFSITDKRMNLYKLLIDKYSAKRILFKRSCK